MKNAAAARSHVRRSSRIFLLACATLIGATLAATLAPTAQAKNLSQRLGLGATNIGAGLLPSLSLDWQVNQATAFEVNFGLDTQDANSSLALGARYFRNLYIEDNLFFHLYLGGGLTSLSTAGKSNAGYLLESGLGAKAFLPGLSNFGLDAGAGFRLESPGAVRLRTVFFGGFHYYF